LRKIIETVIEMYFKGRKNKKAGEGQGMETGDKDAIYELCARMSAPALEMGRLTWTRTVVAMGLGPVD